MKKRTAPIRFFHCYTYIKKTDELDIEKNILNEIKIESIIEKYGEKTAFCVHHVFAHTSLSLLFFTFIFIFIFLYITMIFISK
jgi:hypothetical protein